MKPKSQPRDEFELFQAHFDQLLNPGHELILLANQIDWPGLDAAFADCYSKSDESVVEHWVENPYWQYFCGYTHMQHDCPIHPTSMTKWRNRVGVKRLEELLTETIRLAVREKHLPKRDLAQITVDTTVQEKNITHPTDSKLLYKAIVKLGDAAKSRGIALRQSYVRVGKRAAVMAGRYAHAKQFKRMHKRLRKLRTYVGRLIRDIRRKATDIDDALAVLLDHEFGQKVSVATTNRSNWFVASLLCENNPYDGHTLTETLEAAARVTGVAVTDAYVDKGYRGHGHLGETAVHIAGQRQKNTPRSERKRRRRRSAIEPKIGHLKSDHRMGRCFLARLDGDAINAVLSAAGSNLRKLLGLLRCDGRGLRCALIELLTRLQLQLICRIRHVFRSSGVVFVPVC
jgi:IS5 family transposase